LQAVFANWSLFAFQVGNVTGERLPFFPREAINLFEVLITRNEDQPVLSGNRRDPDIIVRDWATFYAQSHFDQSIRRRSSFIARKRVVVKDKCRYSFEVISSFRGFISSVTEFTQCNR
jgi:hypothetical protein